jgi:branched-chain amino acid transport system substrate-binding protein
MWRRSDRLNVMKQAASLKNVPSDVLLPGIVVNTSPTNFAPIRQLQLMRLKGQEWQPIGEILQASSTE